MTTKVGTVSPPAHPSPTAVHVVSRTTNAPPSLTVSAFIGAAQAKLSLALTKDVPGTKTLQTAISEGPANHVPAAVLTALEAYMKTPQCIQTIADACAVAKYTVERFNGATVPAPKLSASATGANIASAMNAAAGQVARQRKETSHDYGTRLNTYIGAFDIPAGLLFQGLNDAVYSIWGSDGTDLLYGPPLPDLNSASGSGDSSSSGGDGSNPYSLGRGVIQRIQDNVSTFSNSSGGSGGSGQSPADSDDSTTHDSEN